MPEKPLFELQIVLDEMVSNVIKYGHSDGLEHGIHILVTLEGNLLTIEVDDDGQPFNPLEAPDQPHQRRDESLHSICTTRQLVDVLQTRSDGHALRGAMAKVRDDIGKCGPIDSNG